MTAAGALDPGDRFARLVLVGVGSDRYFMLLRDA
jgi:hypothetical protein